MKKIYIAITISIIMTALPVVIYADQTEVAEAPAAAASNQMPDDMQAIVIVNPTPEQVLSAERQISSSETAAETEMVGKEDNASSDEEDAEEEESVADAKEPTFDIPVPLNEKVEAYIHYFTNRIRDKFSIWLSRSEMYLPMMKKTFKEKGLPEDLTYLALIESGFNNKAYSRARAAGQWQFIKGTGKRYGLRIDGWVDERRDPEKATEAAARYLADLYAMFNNWHLAAASYNAGEGKIVRAIHKYKTEDFWQLSQKKNRYLRPETKDYVPKLIAAALIAKEPAKYGFGDIELYQPIVYEKVSINRVMDLRDIAKAGECSPEDLHMLNPELKTNFTPPNYAGYQLKVAVGRKAIIEERMASIPPASEKTALKEYKTANKESGHRRHKVSHRKITRYTVKEGDTLAGISAKYNVQVKQIASWNNIRRPLKKGDKIKIYGSYPGKKTVLAQNK